MSWSALMVLSRADKGGRSSTGTSIQNYVQALLSFVLLTLCSVRVHAADWVDLPYSGYEEILQLSEEQLKGFYEALTCYHETPKDQWLRLEDRMHRLLEVNVVIQNLLQEAVHSFETSEALKLLGRQVLAKHKHLLAMQAVLLLDLQDPQACKRYHEEPEEGSPAGPVLVLRNSMAYSLRMQNDWGGFWWETWDPCHRCLAPYYRRWLTLQDLGKAPPPFLLWLEGQAVPPNNPTILYFDAGQREAYRYEVVDGLLVHSHSKVLAHFTGDAPGLFVIDTRGRLYASSAKPGLRHSSFVSGKPVQASGQLIVEHGQLLGLEFLSGHYMPKEGDYDHTVQLLQDLGLQLPDTLVVTWFEKRSKYRAPLQGKLCADGCEDLLKTAARELVSTCEF